MTRWLRREALAVVLALALATAAVAWTLRLDWRPYQDARPTDVARAAAGDQAVLEGTGFTVTGSEVLPGDSKKGTRLEVAEDAALVVVSLEVEPGVDPDAEPGSPRLRLLDPDGEETRWDTASFTATSWSPPDRFETYVDPEATEPYALQVGYVVPADAVDGLELEVSSLTSLPQALRLELAAGSPPAP